MSNFWNSPKEPFLKRSLVRNFKICLEETSHVNTEDMNHVLSLFRTTKLLSDEVTGSQYVQSMLVAFKTVVNWQADLIPAGQPHSHIKARIIFFFRTFPTLLQDFFWPKHRQDLPLK